jgi:FMN-dependent NADH-azoreductase
MNLLRIDSSILGDHSASRQISVAVVARLTQLTPGAQVTYRDLATEPLPQFSGAVALAGSIPAAQQSDAQRRDTATLARVLEEVLAADVIVIGAPLYNLSIPSQLKSWLDALAVPGKTFRCGDSGVEGLLGRKRVIIASARGGFYGPGTPAAAVEHQEGYLRSFLGFLGITKLEVVRAEGVKVSTEHAQGALQGALQQAAQLEAA